MSSNLHLGHSIITQKLMEAEIQSQDDAYFHDTESQETICANTSSKPPIQTDEGANESKASCLATTIAHSRPKRLKKPMKHSNPFTAQFILHQFHHFEPQNARANSPHDSQQSHQPLSTSDAHPLVTQQVCGSLHARQELGVSTHTIGPGTNPSPSQNPLLEFVVCNSVNQLPRDRPKRPYNKANRVKKAIEKGLRDERKMEQSIGPKLFTQETTPEHNTNSVGMSNDPDCSTLAEGDDEVIHGETSGNSGGDICTGPVGRNRKDGKQRTRRTMKSKLLSDIGERMLDLGSTFKTKRPINSFMAFASHMRNIRRGEGEVFENKHLLQEMAIKWKEATPEFRERYREIASTLTESRDIEMIHERNMLMNREPVLLDKFSVYRGMPNSFVWSPPIPEIKPSATKALVMALPIE